MLAKLAFRTPSDTTIPTLTAAHDKFRVRFRPFVSKTDSVTEHAYRLHTTKEIVNNLWQGHIHLRSILRRNSEMWDKVRHFEKLWITIEGLTLEDAQQLGFSGDEFISPTRNWRVIPQLLRETPALISLGRALDAQFHLGDNPVTFLMRHLGVRLCLRAYADLLCIPSSKTERALQKIVPEVVWHEAPELIVAARLFTLDSEHHTFSYMILREVLFVSDLMELFLRQTTDPSTNQ